MSVFDDASRNPEDFLRKADAAERQRGRFKVFLG